MGRLLLAVVLASAAASGQQPAQSPVPKLDPYSAKALENALRPLESFSKEQKGFREFTPLPSTSLTLLPTEPGKVAEVCAIPLTRVPVHTSIDRGIRRELNLDARQIDDMAVAKLMPACPEDHPLHH